MKAQLGIKESETKKIADLLNKVLADEHVLYIKSRNSHWNVQSPDFHSMHAFFEEIYGELEVTIDEVAERIRTIGHFAVGTMEEYLKLTQLKEMQYKGYGAQGYLKELLEDFETVIQSLREHIEDVAENTKDCGTEDFLIGILQSHEARAWMIRSHLA